MAAPTVHPVLRASNDCAAGTPDTTGGQWPPIQWHRLFAPLQAAEWSKYMAELMRFSVAMPEDLLIQFDNLVARRGLAKNRSEVIRDLVREALVDEEWDDPDAEIVGTLTIVFNHHASDLQNKLDHIQHSHHDKIVSSMHIHLDSHNCLEVIVMRGRSASVREIAESILGVKGVKHGRLTATTTGKYL
jgi:CopG family nickel-responsive transcriptional regulator